MSEVTARYNFSLSEEVLEKAVSELSEPRDNDERLKKIDELRESFIEKHKDYELYRTDDAFILRFLRSCEFDMKEALKNLLCYHKLRKEWREVFDLVDEKSTLQKILVKGPALPLEGKAKDGSFVFLKRPGHGFESNDTVESFVASVFLSYEQFLENEEVQIYGITVIVDVSQLGFRLGIKFASIGKRFVKMVQEVLPMRVVSLNLMNEAWVFDMVFKVVSQFMKERIRSKLQLHGRNYENLHKIVDPCVLPSSLGGTGPEPNVDDWVRKVFGE